MKLKKVIVSQVGAREHYATGHALHQRGMLAGLVTDWYATPWLRWLGGFAGRRGQAARAARCEAIPDRLVHSFPVRSLLWKKRVRRLAAQGKIYEAYAGMDSEYASAVGRLKLPRHDVFFGYAYASLETLRVEKARGVLTILGQIDPGALEFKLMAEEMSRHPGIAGEPPKIPAANFERNQREWELADIIIVNSEWSREALVEQGVDPAKIEILPLAYETTHSPIRNQSPTRSNAGAQNSGRPLKVLWLGQVIVRKGIHYLLEAARLLEKEKVHFDVVGSLGILPEAVKSAPQNVTFHGSVERERAADWYRQSDVFVLPTLSDGFALTQLEAFAHGLPVIATPNCGRVVSEGKTGLIVPPRDSRALAEAILRFVHDPNLASEMASNCREAVKAYSINAYGDRLVEIINKYDSLATASPELVKTAG